MARDDSTAPDPAAVVRSRPFWALLGLSAVVGVVASLAAWLLLEAIHQIQVGVFYDGAPTWWPLPVLAFAGIVVAFVVVRLPGAGGHVPAHGLQSGTTLPVELPGVVLAALATIGLGLVLGPEAPLIALGGGLGLLGVRLIGRQGDPDVATVLAAAGTFAAVSLIFGSPLIAAVLLIEVSGLGGPRLPLMLLPGLLAAGIGSLVSIGMGSFTGLSTSAYALGALPLPAFARPDVVDFGWTVALAIAVSAGAVVVFRGARAVERLVTGRAWLALPLSGLIVAALAIAFGQWTDKPAHEVLFSGQDDLVGLVSTASTWTLATLALLIALKSVAWAISLAGFRGGPTFPAIYLGVAAGIMASHLPGFSLTPAAAVAIGASIAAVLRLPLSAIVIAQLLVSPAGLGVSPLIIVAVVIAYITASALEAPDSPHRARRRAWLHVEQPRSAPLTR